MLAFLTAEPNANVFFDCLDWDSAIAYARNLNAQFTEKLTFYEGNALRFVPPRKYDVVWAVGIFDYVNDKRFVTLLRRLLLAVDSGGELVIGNISVANPSRSYMEFGEWNLHCRTATQLKDLALAAGVAADSAVVDSEPEGINLFLRATC
jgi:hypothetical protein